MLWYVSVNHYFPCRVRECANCYKPCTSWSPFVLLDNENLFPNVHFLCIANCTGHRTKDRYKITFVTQRLLKGRQLLWSNVLNCCQEAASRNECHVFSSQTELFGVNSKFTWMNCLDQIFQAVAPPKLIGHDNAHFLPHDPGVLPTISFCQGPKQISCLNAQVPMPSTWGKTLRLTRSTECFNCSEI